MTVRSEADEGAEKASPRRVFGHQAGEGRSDPCQLLGMIRLSPPAGKDGEKDISLVVRIKLAIKRRLSVRAQKEFKAFISSVFDLFDSRSGPGKAGAAIPETPQPKRLEAGDLVRVRSREEIEATLDHWGSLKGCGFLDEMTAFCGSTQRILKRVERFIDERDFRVKRASGVVLLEGLTCSGTGTTGRCDRACFFFWREEWLERTERAAGNER